MGVSASASASYGHSTSVGTLTVKQRSTDSKENEQDLDAQYSHYIRVRPFFCQPNLQQRAPTKESGTTTVCSSFKRPEQSASFLVPRKVSSKTQLLRASSVLVLTQWLIAISIGEHTSGALEGGPHKEGGKGMEFGIYISWTLQKHSPPSALTDSLQTLHITLFVPPNAEHRPESGHARCVRQRPVPQQLFLGGD